MLVTEENSVWQIFGASGTLRLITNVDSITFHSHLQLNDPSVLLQELSAGQLCAPAVHSSTSDMREICVSSKSFTFLP